jgi:peptidyl-prolyl cis-trans isomerase A (cyclophilin A)
MGKRHLGLTLAAVLIALPGCSQGPEPPAPADSAGLAEEYGYPPELQLPELAPDPSPEIYRLRFDTTEGAFVVEVRRAWSPHGSDRFHHLVKHGFYRDCAFFRGLPGFIIQFGVHGDPEINSLWATATIPDDPRVASNQRGTIAFAQEGPRTRTTQLFINLSDNPQLDATFTPVGRVVEGMGVVDKLFTGYGELHPGGQGPRPALLNRLGNRYLRQQFPELDYIRDVVLE